MKAKRISTGEVIEVTELTFTSMKINIVHRRDKKNGGFIAESDLEFLPDTADKVIEGWLCKEKDIEDTVMLHEDEPHLEWQPLPDSYSYESYGKVYWLPDIFSPDLTYENSPKRVKITITPME